MEKMLLRLNKVLVANREEIACRIICCCKQYGLERVAVSSSEYADSDHVKEADASFLLSGVGASAY